MRNKFYLLLFLLASIVAFAQEKVTLSGTIANKTNNETLIGTSVSVSEANITVYTNSYGYYSITLPKGEYTITISNPDFETLEEKIPLTENLKRNFVMTEINRTETSKTKNIETVVLKGSSTKTNIQTPEMSTNKLTISTIKKMPAVLGEVDVLKSILQLPGVTNAGEGSSGFNVSGGSVDENLVLLDEAIIYNTTHLFGFFSVFNSDVIKDLKLYKGGIPANFGGRVSSVLDIYQKEGNNREFHGNGGIGVIASRLLFEGPIEKEKSSFVIAGRSSYAHLFLKLANEPNSAYFYDLNTKFNYKINDKNNLFVSGYFGKDNINFNNVFVNDYGNSLFNLRWNHIFTDKLFSNVSLIYSNYDYGLNIKSAGANWKSDIKNYNFKYDFKHYLSDKINLSYGINSIYY